ncbi:MAG: hypothetical protein KGZ58_08575 [Ignavibacteriales bacterium]|nr:hypothetical protein [Ignavibacteriales bacterium]
MVALFVIGTFLLFLIIDFVLHKVKTRQTITATPRPAFAEKFLLPRGYFFSPNHSWVELLPSGNARIGIDDFTQKIIGSIDRIHPVLAQTTIKKGEPLLVLTQGERTLAIASPLSGKVSSVNETLLESADVVKTSPYQQGWIAAIEPDNLSTEIKSLSIAEEAVQWLREEVTRFREFITLRTPQFAHGTNGVTMYDGGLPMKNVLESADEQTWKLFETDFLLLVHNKETVS